MTWLKIIGLGPGADALRTPEATAALAEATDIIGYAPYVARVPAHPGQRRHATDNRQELERAAHALALAAAGARVAVVSSGDAGVFAMASAVFEALEQGPPEWRALDIAVLPGLSAMFAAAARLGAPLGHDFCAISLSDNLKPWELVEKRLNAAAGAGFVIALYNPISKARPWQLGRAFELLRDMLPGRVPVAIATAISRPEEKLALTTLAEVVPEAADMRSLVLVGTAESRLVARGEGKLPWLYAPRSARRA
ncbi:precorrin-3B C(17)-methyltransferase [Pseudoroseomonas cervicalis]|uniref:Precorrin-3B C(17)-methyltransferase n=1 Tax=Pseudoroseomonas cervicalis ATCC 49957 TaxID=525371 RepID=D5RL30_9PROT|nr:precorrin-3B C(17)-methyltransferase [Pseudoroseomonas cervicalis]EFH11995.1 precorrin-3B C(17)-methyltransferase [Pseudoroseomonas cervicalis ATCC 49957]